MAKEIVVNSENDQTRIAIIENNELVELYIENPGNERTIGDICLGRVRKIMPSIQAAFVDIGQKQDAFLHFSDLSDNLPELLEYLEDPQPEVGKHHRAQQERHRMKGTRRHPRAVGKEAHPKDEDHDASDAGEPLPEPPEPAEVLEADDNMDSQKVHRARDARSRGTAARRSAARSTARKAPSKPTTWTGPSRAASRSRSIPTSSAISASLSKS